MKKSDNNIIFLTLYTTFPVFMGYVAIGVAFGLLLTDAGYPWFIAPAMSLVIYAGAGQYLGVEFFRTNAHFLEIAFLTLLLNSRHMFYGISLINKFKDFGLLRYYMIFGLTDETYALYTTVKPPCSIDNKKFYFLIALFDHIYWITGSTIGALAGSLIKFDTKGIEFAMTALFTVLLIEQYKHCKKKVIFVIGIFSSATALFISINNMFLLAIIFSIILLFVFKGKIVNDEYE